MNCTCGKIHRIKYGEDFICPNCGKMWLWHAASRTWAWTNRHIDAAKEIIEHEIQTPADRGH